MEEKKIQLSEAEAKYLTLTQAVHAEETRGRTRNWLFIAYPESVPENWRSILDGFHVPWVESPLHDADKNADATEKKAHWHIMLMFDSVKAYQQVLPFSKAVNGSFPVKCQSMRGSIRYFYHADNPEKAQYDKCDIKGHCGADVEKLLELTDSEKSVILAQIFEFISENAVYEFSDLVDYARLWRSDWYDLVVHHYTVVLKNYLQSRRNSKNIRFRLFDDGFLLDDMELPTSEKIRLLEERLKLLKKQLEHEKNETD